MRMVDLILKKRRGEQHDKAELDFIVEGYTAGRIPDYQMSAWMMAVCFKSMSAGETALLTDAMTRSGDVIDLSDLPGIKVDKHSTGGVGDTTTLVVAPLVAACGGTVAKMSGRGLGHTGGTLDKLESVPGVQVEQSIEDFKNIARRIGLCVIGQTGDLVPADKLMYALRDVTGTVESIPLIASSIMSKKLAAGADAIVLDVKTGTGAFMPTLEAARQLSRTMVDIGRHMGRNTVAIITDMNQPLGMAVGNGLEVKEAIEVLSGVTPKADPLYRVCMTLGEEMLLLSRLAQSREEAAAKLEEALDSGAGLAKLALMLQALGGDTACIKRPELLCAANKKIPVAFEKGGYVGNMRANAVGVAAQLLGAGRATKQDKIDPAVGLVMKKRRGDALASGEPFAELYVNDESRLEEAVHTLKNALNVVETPPVPIPFVHEIIR